MEKIFVSISSYRDPELIATVNDLTQKASNPENITFGICHQNTPEELDTFYNLYIDSTKNKFRILNVNYQESQGCCWARAKIQELITDEDFYLQLDSHHRVVEDWDIHLKQMYRNILKNGSDKIIISTYVTPYDFAGSDKITYPFDNVPFYMKPSGFYDFPKVIYRPERIHNHTLLQTPFRVFTMSGHFIFTTTKWAREVPYDPDFYFDGEEDSLSIRSWTSGWNIYCPNIVICYHHYIRKNAKRHTDDNAEWHKLDRVSKDKFKLLLRYEVPAPYGLGKERTLSEYVRYSGIDYTERTILPLDQHFFCNLYLENKSVMKKIKCNHWQEITPQHEFSFTETSPGSFINLCDPSRKLDLMIRANERKVYTKFDETDIFLLAKIENIVYNLSKPMYLKGNKPICVLTLSTPNCEPYAKLSRENQSTYCEKQGYEYLAFQESLIGWEIVTWNKVFLLEQYLDKYEWCVWMDNDAIITNPKVSIEDILNRVNQNIWAIFCDDIGGWKLNTGVMIWKNTPVSRKVIREWLCMEKIGHDQGAEQAQLIKLLDKYKQNKDYMILPRKTFNQHIREFKKGDFILHLMGESGETRIQHFSKHV